MILSNYEAEQESTIIRQNAYGEMMRRSYQRDSEEDQDEPIQIIESQHRRKYLGGGKES